MGVLTHHRESLAAALLVAALLGAGLCPAVAAQTPSAPPPVEPRFDLGVRGHGPFPSDRLTVADAAQRTGRRVALPVPNCAIARSACDDIRLLNELDGFDLSPRLALPFSGLIDLSSVTARSVLLVRLAPGPPEAMGVDRLVYDPRSHTLYARPEGLLEPETRYGLVVTRELRDARGRPIQSSTTFHRLLQRRDPGPVVRAYRHALQGLMVALTRRGVPVDQVAVASVFTTGSVTTFLERARDALDLKPPGPAFMTAAEGGGRAFFPRASLESLVLRRQVRVQPDTADGFQDAALPLAALPQDSVGGVGVGWFWSPLYLTPERRILEGPTARPLTAVPVNAPVPFVITVPAGSPPPGGWPVAIMGHGYGGEMFASAFLIAGTLARHGIATAAITVVGHGGGPESRLVATRRDGGVSTVAVPGRGLDRDGDGKIERSEGLGATGALASLALRDGLRQQVVDLLALVRALRSGLDVDGDEVPDTRGDGITYVGQSLGGIYGTLFLAVEPRVRVGVLNVPGGPVAEIARLAPVFRPLVRDTLARRTPPLGDGERDFREDLPLRGEPPVIAGDPGALAIQEYLARVEWLGRRGDPIAYARHVRLAPLAGHEPKQVLVQFALGDRVVPNPTTSTLVRAGQLGDATALLRYDRIAGAVPRELAEPHGFLLRIPASGVAGAVARAAQEQVARFFVAGGATVWNPDEGRPFAEPVFEVPAASLPDRLSYEPSVR
ncbi:MAG: Ig-like domain-containing protein [Candidatus Rokuibacteriota bacterium]